MKTLENLQELIGEELNYDDIICCFDDAKEVVILNRSNNDGYDYIAYENTEDSEQYLFKVDDEDIIIDIWEVER